MKQKTAIRQLIDDLKACQLEWAGANSKAPRVNVIEVGLTIIGEVIKKAESLEPVNEQQIKDAWFDGESIVGSKTYEDYLAKTFEKP